MSRNEVEVGVKFNGVSKAVSDVKTLTDSIKGIEGALKTLETKSSSGQKTLSYFKGLQTEIKETKKQLLELKKSGTLDPTFNVDRAIKDLDNANRKIDRNINKRTLAITGTKAKELTPIFEEVSKSLEQVNNKIKEATQFQKDATNAFAQMGNIKRKQAAEERQGYEKYLEDTFKGYKKDRNEYIKNKKTGYKQVEQDLKVHVKNTENILSPFTKKTSLLQGFSILSGAGFKRFDVDTQLKTVDTAMSQLGLRISTLKSNMTEAFATGRVADVTKEMGVLGKHVQIVQSTFTKHPLLQTEDSIGRLALLQHKLKETAKDYNTFLHPPTAKQGKIIPGMDELSGSLRTLKMKLSETSNVFEQFKLKKIPLIDLQASVLIARKELANFIKQARQGGLTDAFAKDIAGARNELKKLEAELKKAQAPVTQKIRIGRGFVDFTGLDTTKEKLNALAKSSFDLGTGLQYVSRTGLYVVASLTALGTFALRSFANLEQANMAFKSLTGSAEKGSKIFNELVQFAQKSPVDLKSLMSGTRQMLALGFAAEEVVPMMKALSEAIVAVGASPETLDRVTLALSQIQGKGKLVGEEIRQIANTGLPILEVLTKKMGLKNVEQLYEVMKKQTISGRDAVLAIAAGLHEKFAGFFELKRQTLQGSWQVLITNVEVMLGKLGEKLNQSFVVPKALLYIAGVLEDLGDLIKTYPSILPIIQQITGLTVVLIGLTGALYIAGQALKVFSYLTGELKIVFTLLAIPASLIAPIFVLVGGLYLIATNLSKIALWAYRAKIAVIEWRLSFTQDSGIKAQLEKDLAEVKKFQAEIQKSQQEKSIFGDTLKAGQKEYDDFFKNLNFEEFSKKFGKIGKDVKDIWGETVKSLKDIDLLGRIFGKNSDYNAAKEKIQRIKQAISELIAGGAKEKDPKIQKFLDQLSELEIPSSLKDSLDKLKSSQQEVEAEFRFSGDAIEYNKNKIKTLELGIKDLYLIQERVGTSNALLDQLNLWNSSLKENSETLTFLYKDKIANLKTYLTSAGQDVVSLVKEFETQNSELMATGNTLKILASKYDFFTGKVKDIKTPVDNAAESWKNFNKEIYGANVLMGVTIDYFEATERRVLAAKTLLESLYANKAPQVDIDKASIELVNAYNTQIQNLRLQLNSLGADSEKVIEILKDLGPNTSILELMKIVKKLQKLVQDLGGKTKETWDKEKAITDLKEHAARKLGDAIKNIWNQTEMTFKDVWHGALDTFVDVMVQMMIQTEITTTYIKIQMAAATAGISLVLGMLAMAFGGKKTVKVEPLTDRLKKVFDNFITDFKGAMGDFKERLFPSGKEISKEMSQTQKIVKGLNILRDALTPELLLQTSPENLYPPPPKGFTKSMASEINIILKEIGSSTIFKEGSDSINRINDKIVQLTEKLSENIVDITTLMVDRFEKIKEVVQNIHDIEKDRASFVKDMTQTITDVTRTGMGTGKLLGLQQGDVAKLQGEVDINQTNLSTIKDLITAAYDWKGLTEDEIALRKIDIEYLKKEQKDLSSLQIEKIAETKDAYLKFWDTVQTVVSETLDLIKQKSDFIKDIMGTITEVQKYNKSSQTLLQQNIDSMNTLKNSFDKASGTNKLSLGGQLKDALMSTWESAKTFFNEITTKITDLVSNKSSFGQGIQDTIKGIKEFTMAPVELLKSQQANVTVLQEQLKLASPEDKIKLGEQLKTAITSAWETGKGIFGDITSLENELSGINDNIKTETNIAKLAELGQQKLTTQAKIDAIKQNSGLTSITKFQDTTVGQLTSLETSVSSAYDEMIGIQQGILDSMGALTGPGGWQEKTVNALNALITGSSGAYDDLIKSSASLLGITKTTDITTGDVETALGVIQNTLLANLGNLKDSGVTSFNDLISVELLALGVAEAGNEYLKAIEKGIYGTLTILGEIGKNAANATGGNVDTIKSTLSTLFAIPMASGGVVTKPTLAIVGEAGPEAVVPLNKMRQSGNVNISIEGAMIMDEITMSKFARTIGSKIKNQQLRYV